MAVKTAAHRLRRIHAMAWKTFGAQQQISHFVLLSAAAQSGKIEIVVISFHIYKLLILKPCSPLIVKVSRPSITFGTTISDYPDYPASSTLFSIPLPFWDGILGDQRNQTPETPCHPVRCFPLRTELDIINEVSVEVLAKTFFCKTLRIETIC